MFTQCPKLKYINMKKRYLFFAFVILTLLGCNKETDLSGIEQELADLRNKNKELQNEIDDMKKPIPADPVLEYLNFLAQDNPSQLSADDHTPLVIKAIARLDIHGIGALEILQIARIGAKDEFVFGIAKDVTRKQFCCFVMT